MKIKLLKIIFLILIALSVAIFATGCENGSKSNSHDEITDKNEDTEDEQGDIVYESEFIDIIKNGVCEYELVYPANCDNYINSVVSLFTSYFKSATGITLTTSEYDVSEDDFSHKIVFGKIDNDDIQSIYSELKYYDYEVNVSNDNIIIAAYSYDGYLRAIDHIRKNVLSHTENDGMGVNLKMKAEGYKNSMRNNYAIDIWTIHGVDLSEYRIVYADNNIKTEVIKFRDDIAKACGYYMDIVKDCDSEPRANEIIIGNTNRTESIACAAPLPMNFYAKIYGTKLVIKSGGIYSQSKMLDSLLNIIMEKSDGKISMGDEYICEGDLFDDPLDSSYAVGSDIRIMSCNVLAELESWSLEPTHYPYLPVRMREELLFAALDYYRPTIVGFQELTSDWYRAIEDNYHNYERWELLKFDNPNRDDNEYVFSTVMYRKDLYTLLDSGMSFYSKHDNARARCYTWAVLKVNGTDRKFCFVSTHWDGSGKPNGFLQAAELSEFVNGMRTDLPVFTTGDFNSNENSSELKKFFEICESVDAKYAAVEQMNNIGSWHTFLEDDISWGSCDHITATKDTTVLKFQTLHKNGLIYASDHCWLIADIKLDAN